MASMKNAGRRRFITRQHTSDTSEADATTVTSVVSKVKTPEEEEVECERRRLEKISLPRDTPSAFVRVAPSSSSSSSSKSAANLDWTFRGSKNGLAVPSSSRRLPQHHHQQQQQQPSVPLNSEPNNAPFHQLASEKIVQQQQQQQQPLIYATLENTATGFPPDCDSLSLGFRPIRRDSLGSTSSSLAGSTVDSELTISNTAPPDQPFDSPQRIVKLPPHPSGKDLPESSSSKLRPWSYYDGGGMLGPRTVLSSTGSASSYDNLDKMDSTSNQKLQLNSDATQVHLSPSPRFARTKHFDGGDSKRTPSPPPSSSIRRHGSPFRSDDDRQFYVVGSRTHGSTSKETMSGEDRGEGPHFLDGVCRRRMAGGHVQVIPPHLVGVFDPSRFLPTSAVHAPSETNASGYVDAEKTNVMSITKQPESNAYHAMGKLPSKLPVQPGYVRPSESSGKSLLPRVSGQHTSRDVADHSSSGHVNPTLPFASTKDSGLSMGETLSSTSKANVGRKSYRNEDLPAKDASPKFSDKRLFSTGRKGGSNISSQEQQELSSVTDLFHHVLPNTDSSSHYSGGPVFKDTGPHYPHEQKDPQMSLTKPNAYLSTNHSSPSKQGSPKYAQTSAQKSSPKWESSISSRGGKKYEQTASPKTSPKIVPRHNNDQPKSSPKWERTSSAKSHLASSPKSSPKQERTAGGRRSLKWEAPSTTTTSSKSSQQSSKSISKWEPPALSSKDNARSKVSSSLTTASATGDHQLASFSGARENLGEAEGVENERIVERTQYNRTVSDSGQSRSQSAIAESIRLQEKPRVSGDVSLTRTRSERDKRKTTSTQLAAVGAPDSVFSARRKQFPTIGNHDKVDHQSRTDVTVDRASRSRQNMDEGRDTSIIGRVKPETGNSPSELKPTLDVRRNSNSPRKTADDAICPSDAASDRTSSTSSSLHGIENKGDAAEQQRLRKSDSGESDAHSTRSSAQSADIVKVSLGEDAVREVAGMDVDVMESGSAAAAAAAATGGGLDATLNDDAINSNDAKDSVALKSTEDATVVSNGAGTTTVVADASTNDKEINANVGDDGDLEVPRSKVRVSAACCPQTKTFTDILESIQVVTQPCGGGLTVSSSQETPGTTPVFGPPTSSSSAHFPLFDVNDEPVVKKSSRGSLPDEVFASAPVDASKKSIECITDQPSSVSQLILSGEKSPGSCSVESAQRKTEQNADVVNNNLKETCPSTQTICLEQPKISSPVLHERRSLDSISSSSLVELPTKEFLADESSNVRTTAADPKYSVSVAQQLRYPAVVDKAIFTVDKEISFVSGLLEPEKRSSLPRKVSPQTSLQDAGHMEYLPMKSEPSPNAKLLTDSESAPFMLVTVSSVATDPKRDAAHQSFSLGHVDKMPGAFQNPSPSNVHAFPTVQSTTSRLDVADHCFSREKSPLSPLAALPSVFDCCPLSESLNQNESAILGNKNDDLVERDKVVSNLVERDKVVSNLVERDKVVSNSVERDKVVSNFVERDKVVSNLVERDKVVSDLDESDDETIDQGGNESKVSTASLDQLTQETEIFELAKTSAAYLKPEMTSTSTITFFPPVPPTKTEESTRPAGKTQLIVTPSTFSKATLSQNNDLAKRAFVFTSKESMNVNEHPNLENRANASPLKSEVSPVMAALDDALAVLTSVVMETKTSVDTLPRSAASSSVPSKKDALKQDIEKVILGLNTDTKKPGRSKITNKEGSSSSSKKRSSVASHKEQQQQQQQQHHTLFRSSPIATSHHSDPLEATETMRQEIETVENQRRHRLSKDDSFNRPDSPMFHETLPLPKDSIIRRNREHCRDSSSSSDSGGSPQASPRLAPRNLRRSKRGQDTTSKSGSATTPLETPGYRPFMGGHSSSGRTLSRHQSDIVLDMQSLPVGQHLHRTRRHNSDSADPGKGPWPKTVSLAQGMDAVTGQPAGAGAAGVRDGKRRTDRFPLPSDIQQSLLLYNQQHGGRRGQSWMQAVDASVEGTVFTGGPVHTKDRTG